MGLRIATNVPSLSAQRNIQTAQRAQQSNLEHLASGSRINQASDDAAGLAISENMKSQIRSIRQANRNANDAISMIQTAEGGMNEVSSVLTRLKELSVQAASDTIGNSEREFIDKEVQQLKGQVEGIAHSTEFDGKKLLSGKETISFQVGIHNEDKEDRMHFETAKLNTTTDRLGISDLHTKTRDSARENLDQLDSAMQTISEHRATLGALQNRLQSSINNLTTYHENLSRANSQIRDTDIASESAELTKNNILASAGVSVLAQANQNNTSVLKLIG
jgi:flagellin